MSSAPEVDDDFASLTESIGERENYLGDPWAWFLVLVEVDDNTVVTIDESPVNNGHYGSFRCLWSQMNPDAQRVGDQNDLGVNVYRLSAEMLSAAAGLMAEFVEAHPEKTHSNYEAIYRVAAGLGVEGRVALLFRVASPQAFARLMVAHIPTAVVR